MDGGLALQGGRVENTRRHGPGKSRYCIGKVCVEVRVLVVEKYTLSHASMDPCA